MLSRLNLHILRTLAQAQSLKPDYYSCFSVKMSLQFRHSYAIVMKSIFSTKQISNSIFNLEITTLENAVYMNYKNDISFVFDFELLLYEHQSGCRMLMRSGRNSLRWN